MNAIPARRRLCCTRFVPAPQRPRSASAGGGEDASTQASSPLHRERLQSGLTQRDMWVMHSPAGAGEGGRFAVYCLAPPSPAHLHDTGVAPETAREPFPCACFAPPATHYSVRGSDNLNDTRYRSRLDIKASTQFTSVSGVADFSPACSAGRDCWTVSKISASACSRERVRISSSVRRRVRRR